jgi:hypothetical protein
MIPPYFLQIPTPPAGAIENFLITLAAIASMVVLGRKFLPRKSSDSTAGAQVLILADKVASLEGRMASFEAKLDHLGESIHNHLNQLEAGLARVDERTRK